jgi:hypothetical protein
VGLLFIPLVIYEHGDPWWNDIDRGNRRTQRKICPSATLSTTDPTWIDMGVNLGFWGERPAITCLNHGMVNRLEVSFH